MCLCASIGVPNDYCLVWDIVTYLLNVIRRKGQNDWKKAVVLCPYKGLLHEVI